MSFNTQLHSQYYQIENKKIQDDEFTGNYGRIFPMTGLYYRVPMIHKKYNINILPKFSFILNSSQSNSNKISNEESTNNKLTIFNSDSLNRYIGTDQLDNSKRANYGIDIVKDKMKIIIPKCGISKFIRDCFFYF